MSLWVFWGLRAYFHGKDGWIEGRWGALKLSMFMQRHIEPHFYVKKKKKAMGPKKQWAQVCLRNIVIDIMFRVEMSGSVGCRGCRHIWIMTGQLESFWEGAAAWDKWIITVSLLWPHCGFHGTVKWRKKELPKRPTEKHPFAAKIWCYVLFKNYKFGEVILCVILWTIAGKGWYQSFRKVTN